MLYYSKYNHFDDKYPDTNMIMQMILLKFKVVEIPAVMHMRKSGKSMHSGLKPILVYVSDVLLGFSSYFFDVRYSRLIMMPD